MSSTETGSRITSGAGFSQVFLRPEYQEKYVKEYLSTFDQDVPSSWYSQKVCWWKWLRVKNHFLSHSPFTFLNREDVMLMFLPLEEISPLSLVFFFFFSSSFSLLLTPFLPLRWILPCC